MLSVDRHEGYVSPRCEAGAAGLAGESVALRRAQRPGSALRPTLSIARSLPVHPCGFACLHPTHLSAFICFSLTCTSALLFVVQNAGNETLIIVFSVLDANVTKT